MAPEHPRLSAVGERIRAYLGEAVRLHPSLARDGNGVHPDFAAEVDALGIWPKREKVILRYNKEMLGKNKFRTLGSFRYATTLKTFRHKRFMAWLETLPDLHPPSHQDEYKFKPGDEFHEYTGLLTEEVRQWRKQNAQKPIPGGARLPDRLRSREVNADAFKQLQINGRTYTVQINYGSTYSDNAYHGTRAAIRVRIYPTGPKAAGLQGPQRHFAEVHLFKSASQLGAHDDVDIQLHHDLSKKDTQDIHNLLPVLFDARFFDESKAPSIRPTKALPPSD